MQVLWIKNFVLHQLVFCYQLKASDVCGCISHHQIPLDESEHQLGKSPELSARANTISEVVKHVLVAHDDVS